MPKKIIKVDSPNINHLEIYKDLQDRALNWTALYLKYGGKFTVEDDMAKVGNLKVFTCGCKPSKEKGPWVRVVDQYVLAFRNENSEDEFIVVKHQKRIICAHCNRVRFEGKPDILGMENYLD